MLKKQKLWQSLKEMGSTGSSINKASSIWLVGNVFDREQVANEFNIVYYSCKQPSYHTSSQFWSTQEHNFYEDKGVQLDSFTFSR